MPGFAIDGRSMSVTIEQAKEILGDDCVGPEELRGVLGADLDTAAAVPFSAEELAAAKSGGDLLIYRCARSGGKPLTIAALVEKQPLLFREKLLRGSGYQLKNDWGILLEPLAEADTCADGWALVTADVLPQTCNLAYAEQDVAIREHLESRGLTTAGARRRSAVEAVYDSLAFAAARGRRLLARTWDWTSSRTEDRGILQVGGFGASGMEVIAYSPGVRHGALGACLTRQPGN